MNKIYQVIWNRVRNCYVVVSELARRDGKGTLRRRKAAAVVTAGTLGAWLLALGTGVSPALAAEPAAGIIQKNQYVGFKAAAGDPSGKNWVVNGATYNRVRVDGQWWWVREGYVVSSTEGSKYTPLSQTGEHYDVSYTGSGNQPADILAAVSSLVSASGTATNAGESLNRISASAFEGVSTGVGTGVAGGWDYIIYDPSWKDHAVAYADGYANVRNTRAGNKGFPLGFVTTATAGSKLAWDDTLSRYTYAGTPVDPSNLYVVGDKVGVFTNYEGTEVYRGTVYGANNEILKTVYKNGAYYSYWAAQVTDSAATMSTYRVADYNHDLDTLVQNDTALYHNDIKSVDMAKGGTAAAPTATISVLRNGVDAAQAVDGAVTVSGGGGTGGADTFLTLSNQTDGATVTQTFQTGSRVVAGTADAPAGSQELKSLVINGVSYDISKAADPLGFGGDNAGVTLFRGAGERLDILGGADSAALTDSNIGVVAQDGALNVRLAKKLTNLDSVSANAVSAGSVTADSVTAGHTTIDTTGITIVNTGDDTKNVVLQGNTVSLGGNRIQHVADGTDGTDAVNLSQLQAMAAAGLNFQGNDTDKTVHIAQGGTLRVQGTGGKDAAAYSGENILVTASPDNSRLNIGLDKNLRVDSVTAGQASDGDVTGYAGTVYLVGPAKDSTKYVKTAITAGQGAADEAALDDSMVARLRYQASDGARHVVATLEDGLSFAGDAGAPVNRALNGTLTLAGGVTDPAALTNSNIGVVAKADGTGFDIKLAKNLTGLTSATLGTDVVLGTQLAGDAATETGDYLRGLDNKTWTVGAATKTPDRAATEGQLQSVSNVAAANQAGVAQNKEDIAKGLNFAANTKMDDGKTDKTVRRQLGDTVSIKGHDKQTDHTYKTDNLTTELDDDGNLTILMDTQLTADRVTVGTGSHALTLDGTDGTLKTGSSTLDGSGLDIAGGPSVTTSGIQAGSRQIQDVASGATGSDTSHRPVYDKDTNAANIGDVKTLGARMVTVSGDSSEHKNTKVKKTTAADGTVDYEVTLNDVLTLGSAGGSTAVLNGTVGTLTLGTLASLDGAAGTGTVGSLRLGNYTGTGPWVLTDTDGHTVTGGGAYLTGLTNTSWNTAAPVYVSGRAATEDELAAVSQTVTDGWELQVDGTKRKDVTPAGRTLNMAAGSNIELGGSGDTLTIATKKDVDFDTVRTGGAGGILMGVQDGGGANVSRASYLTGLANTDWQTDNIVANRAATEGQLNAVAKLIKGEASAADIYVTGGGITYDASGNSTLTLTRGNTAGTVDPVTVQGHDYYVKTGSLSDDGKTLTLTRNDGDITVDMSNLYHADDRLVAADTESGEYTVDGDGKVTLQVTNAADQAAGKAASHIVIAGIASQAELDQGFHFTASTMAEGATHLSYKARLGDTIGIFGKQQAGHTYNSDNITTTIDDRGNIRILLDDNLTATSLTAGAASADDTEGVNGSVKATGKDGAYVALDGEDGSLRLGNATGNHSAIVQNYGGQAFLAGSAAPDGSAPSSAPRLQYWAAGSEEEDAAASRTLHTLATLEDGLSFTGDAGATAGSGATVSRALNSALTLTGGVTNPAALIDTGIENIGVVANAGGTGFDIRLARDLKGLTTISLGTDMVLGNQSAGSTTSDYLTGLDNTTWTGTGIVSGRAATEDQLKTLSDKLSNHDQTTGGFGLTADGGAAVKQDLGKTIAVLGDGNISTAVDGDNKAIQVSLSKDLNLTSSTLKDASGNTAVLNGNGLSLRKAGTTGTDNLVSLTTEGLNNGGNQIVNVKSGLDGTTLQDAKGTILNHAATIGDLKTAASNLTDAVTGKGLDFAGNTVDAAGNPVRLHADLGETVSILGTGKKEDDSYSSHNVKVKLNQETNALYVELDKDFLVRSLQAGYQDEMGQILINGKDRDGDYSPLAVGSRYVQKPYLGGTDGAKRLIYTTETLNKETMDYQIVATLEDGLSFTGDAGAAAGSGATVTRTLNSTLTLTGGVTDPSALTDSNIGVVAKADGTGFDIKLAKDLKDLDSITMTGGLKISSSGTSRTMTGLTNTTWDAAQVVSDRAATEGQLKEAVDQAVGRITEASQGGGFALAGDDGNKVGQDLGKALSIQGDGNITTSVDADNKALQIHLNKDIDLGADGSLKAGGIILDQDGIDMGGKKITNVASGRVHHDDTDNTNAANIGDVKALAKDIAGQAVSGGRVFAGDDGETVTVGLGETMQVTGGQSDTSKLTTGNIGVVKDGGAGLSVRLSSELTGLTSVSAGNSTMNNDGFTVQNGSGAAGIRVTGSGITIAQDGDGTHAVEISNSKISVGGQQIHEIAAGTAVTDAVNVGQLNGAMENVSNTIGRLGSRVDRVGAGSAALAALHPLEYDPDDKFNVAAGFGHYRGANAAAIGAFFQPDERVRLNLGGSMGGGENMLNAGITFSLDPVRGTHLKSRTALTREVQQLRTDNQTLREDNQKVHEQLAAMSDQLNKLSALVEKLSAETEAKP